MIAPDYMAHDREDGRLIDTARHLALLEEPEDAQAQPDGAPDPEPEAVQLDEPGPEGEAPEPDDPGEREGPDDGADGPAGVRDPAPQAAGGAGDGPDAGAALDDEDAPPSWTYDELADAPGELPAELEEPAMAANDFRILSAPTISLERFTNVLRNAGSPAAKEAAGMYNAAVKYGVDPAILLAIMRKESGFGKLGIAVGRNNGWGLRYYASYADLGGVNKAGWTAFPSWTRGAEAASRLLAGGLYGKSGKYNTARRFPFRWAPASDGNAPRKYGAQLVDMIRGWGGTPGVTTGAIGGKAGTTKLRTGAKASGTAKAAKAKAKAAQGKPDAGSGVAPALQSGVPGIIIVAAIGIGIVLLIIALRGGGGRSVKLVED